MHTIRNRIFCLLLCGALILAGCGESRPSSAAPGKESTSVPAESSATAATTPAAATSAEMAPAETTEPAGPVPEETTPIETTPAETTPAETTPAETTPEAPGPDQTDAEQLLKEAAAELDARPDYMMRYSYGHSFTVAGEEFSVLQSGTVCAERAGTQEMAAREEWDLTVTVNGEETAYSYRRIYTSGRAAQWRNGTIYLADVGAEDFEDWMFDRLFFEPDMVTSVRQKEGSPEVLVWTVDLGELTVYEAADGEAVAFGGELELDADGRIVRETYSFRYMLEGNLHEESGEIRFEPLPQEEQPGIPDPEDGKAIRTEDLRAVELLDAAVPFLKARRLSADYDFFGQSYAAGQVLLHQEKLGWDRTGDLKLRDKVDATTYALRNVTVERDSRYEDGVLDVEEDGEHTRSAAREEDVFRTAYSHLLAFWPDTEAVQHMKLTEEDDYWFLEFDFREEAYEPLQAELCEQMFDDGSYLMRHASSLKTDEARGWLSIDRSTGMPMVLGTSLNFRHIIQGRSYELSAVTETSVLPADPNVMLTITDELPEPERDRSGEARPLFYHVTAPNGHEMWLLGTIHVGDERTAFLPKELYDAFDAAGALAVECDTSVMDDLDSHPDLLNAYLEASLYSDGTTVYDHLDEEQSKLLRQTLKAYGGYFTLELMDYKLSSVSSTIDNNYMKFGRRLISDRGVDDQLMTRARESGKEIREVESVEFQIRMLSDFPELWQQMEAKDIMRSGRLSYNFSLQGLFDLWCAGDEERMTEELTGEDEEQEGWSEEELEAYQAYNKSMMLDRNAHMIEVAKEYMNGDVTVFYAVGLAHLLGENGIVKGLRDAGYTVELVEYAE